MSTHSAEWPEGLGAVVQEQAGPLAEARLGTGPDSGGEEGGGEVRPREAWPSFFLGAEDLRQPEPTRRAVIVGWRALLRRGGQAVLADVDTSADEPFVRQVHYGALADGVDSVRGRLGRMDLDELGGGGPMEERLLTVPAAYFSGVWLHDEADHSRDVVVPVQPVPPGLEEGRRYPFAELCALLAERVVDPPP